MCNGLESWNCNFYEQFWSLQVEDWSKYFSPWRHSIYIHYFLSILYIHFEWVTFCVQVNAIYFQVHRFISNNTLQWNMLPRHACMNPWTHRNTWLQSMYQSYSHKKHKQTNTLHLERNNSRHKCRLETTQLESTLEEKDLRVLVDTKLNTSQGCASVAISSLLGYFKSAASRSGWVILEKIQQRVTKVIRWLGYILCKKRLWELRLFSLKKAQGIS